MNRREFLITTGGVLAPALLPISQRATQAQQGGNPAMDTSGLQKTYLFTDLQHIMCGDLQWVSPTGEALPVAGPPEPQVEAQARLGWVARGIRLVAQHATNVELLPKGDARGARTIHDGGVYRSWRLNVQYPPGQNLGAYSAAKAESVAIVNTESGDGFEWKQVAHSEFQTPGQTGFDGFTVFIDPSAPEAERYKAIFMAVPPEDQRPQLWQQYQQIHPRYRDERLRESYLTCMYGAVSPDGLNWHGIPEPLMIHKSDTDTSVHYDAWLGRYIMYTRLYPLDRRTVGRAETADFRKWEGVEPMIWPDLDLAPSDDVYTNGYSRYPGTRSYHLMFPMIYHRINQTSDIYLYTSPDGICWNRVPGGPVITPGMPGHPESVYIYAGRDLVPFGDDRIAVPYSGTSFPHKYPRWPAVLQAGRAGWAFWPRGRLVAVQADQEGEFHAWNVDVAGRELRVNVRTSPGGELRVGIDGVDGRSADDCDPLSGDGLAVPVHWKGEPGLKVADGQDVNLHFKLRAAELFGFEWV